MHSLSGKVAVVTGGTKGVGRGVAAVLAQCGARVFVTGRSAALDRAERAGIVQIKCDHRLDGEVDAAFDLILRDASRIDLLVNSVWGGYDGMVEGGEFTWPRP